MRLTIHQPEHMPWLGFFHKIIQADRYIVLDSVQYRHKYFQNRNRIKSKNGVVWINVPVATKGRRLQKINEVEINNDIPWQRKCLHTIMLNYSKAPYYELYLPHIKALYNQPWKKLIDFNLAAIGLLLNFLDYNTPLAFSSEIGVSGGSHEDILKICKILNATEYLSGVSGIGGRGRAIGDSFLKEDINVIYQEFHHPIYKQLYQGFIPCLSILDLLFNHGPKSRDILYGKATAVMEEVFL